MSEKAVLAGIIYSALGSDGSGGSVGGGNGTGISTSTGTTAVVGGSATPSGMAGAGGSGLPTVIRAESDAVGLRGCISMLVGLFVALVVGMVGI